MRRSIIFTADADRDIEDVFSYIADFGSIAAANRFANGLRAYCIDLADFPERGTRRHGVAEGLRTIPFRRQATIVYSIDERAVVIQRVFYRGRDIGKALNDPN